MDEHFHLEREIEPAMEISFDKFNFNLSPFRFFIGFIVNSFNNLKGDKKKSFRR